MTDANTVSPALATLGTAGWQINPGAGPMTSWRLTAATSFIVPRTGLYYISGCGGGGGGGNGEAAAGGGGGGGGGGARSTVRYPLWLTKGDIVTCLIGAGGGINTNGGVTQVFVNGRYTIGINQGGFGGNGAAGVGGGGGFVGGSFQGQSATAAGANSTSRTGYGGMHYGSGSTGSGGGHTGLSAGVSNVLESDTGTASTGQSGGGHGGTTQFGLDQTALGVGGAPGVSGQSPGAGNYGAGGGGGGAAASPGSGAPGHDGVLYLESAA